MLSKRIINNIECTTLCVVKKKVDEITDESASRFFGYIKKKWKIVTLKMLNGYAR